MDKPLLNGRRVDWLCNQLLEDVARKFLHGQHIKAAGFQRNAAIEALVHASALRALSISDTDVSLPKQAGEPAFVCSSASEGVEHTVCNPGSAEATCSCVHSQRGNLCKHLIKVRLIMPTTESLRSISDEIMLACGHIQDDRVTHEVRPGV